MTEPFLMQPERSYLEPMIIGSEEKYPACNLSKEHRYEFIVDGVPCNSIAGFLFSLRFSDQEVQKETCLLYGRGAEIRNLVESFHHRKSSQKLHWNGVVYRREDYEYQELLDHAFNQLAEQNKIFQEALLATGDREFKCLSGEDDPKKTLITCEEFTGRLTRLRVAIRRALRRNELPCE